MVAQLLTSADDGFVVEEDRHYAEVHFYVYFLYKLLKFNKLSWKDYIPKTLCFLLEKILCKCEFDTSLKNNHTIDQSRVIPVTECFMYMYFIETSIFTYFIIRKNINEMSRNGLIFG